jgi:hypothetical protein
MRAARLSDTMIPLKESMSIAGSADVNTIHICYGGELPECFLSGESGYSGKQTASEYGRR